MNADARDLIALGRKLLNAQLNGVTDREERQERIDQAMETLATADHLTQEEKERGLRALRRARMRV